MSTIRRGGIIFAQTCVQIPEELRDAARVQGIGLSSTLTEALETKMKEGNAQGQNATNTETLAPLSSTDEQVDV
jgi:post-segregation antitoxin (ccd killing protein)